MNMLKWYYNMKIVKKLLAGFILVAVIAGLIGVVGIINIGSIAQNDKALYENMVVPMQDTVNIAMGFQDVRNLTRDMILDVRISDINADYDQIKVLQGKISEYASKYETKIISPEERAIYDSFLASRVEFQGQMENFLKVCLENKEEVAVALLRGSINDSMTAEGAAINQLVQLKVDDAKAASDENAQRALATTITMIIFIIIGMVISVILGLFISRTISNPVKKIAKAAESIAAGDLNVHLEVNSKDEIGLLAHSFRRMSDNLNEVMSNINASSEQVASGAKQVSESSMVLSQGATEQASSLEQLTASIEEISSQTNLNSENANKANKLAEEARINAEHGNSQMKEMLKAMDEINESSGNISKIIKVIDEIAFQTNILALNAAVEAARAGQHGRGFAVVAEEVRNLAARSANAAKETTAMIEGSIKKVEGGTKIANQTANALNSIVNGITTVSSLVGNIAIASHEQATGIEQINQGIVQVSNVVQTNSATSEESASASEQLSGQAQLLKQQAVKFKLKKASQSSISYREFENLEPEILRIIEDMNQRKKLALSDDSDEEKKAKKIKKAKKASKHNKENREDDEDQEDIEIVEGIEIIDGEEITEDIEDAEVIEDKENKEEKEIKEGKETKGKAPAGNVRKIELSDMEFGKY